MKVIEMNKRLRILRVSMTYPRDTAPGYGLHGYYYSMYSDYDELILTAKRDGVMPKNREGVRIVEIDEKITALATYKENKLRRLLSFIRKITEQIRFLYKSKRYIDDFKPDVVHIFTPIPILCGMYARKKCGSKIVMSLHGSDALRMSKVRLFARILEIPDAVVVVGEDMIDVLPADVKTKRPIVCIGNGVDLQVFTNQHKPREKQFIHVGNLRWQKGQEYLIKGFAEFYSLHPDYRLVMIGEGEEREKLQSLCVNLGVQEVVEFRGTQGRQYIADELNKSRAFVLTSVSEGFPKVIIEAMATGTPVISSDVGNIRKVVGDSGIIFEPKNVEAVYAAMTEIVNNELHWTELSDEAARLAQSYSWEAVVDKLDAVYRDVLQ